MPMRKTLLVLAVAAGLYTLYSKKAAPVVAEDENLFKEFSDNYRVELDEGIDSLTSLGSSAYDWAGDRWDSFTGTLGSFWPGSLE